MPSVGGDSSTVSVTISQSEAVGLPIGAVVNVTVKGRVIGANEHYDEKDKVRLEVEGTASVAPGSMDDAASAAIKQLSNASEPKDFVMGQRELHAP